MPNSSSARNYLSKHFITHSFKSFDDLRKQKDGLDAMMLIKARLMDVGAQAA